MRRGIWEDHFNMIEQHNREASFGVHSYKLGMNHFGDLVSCLLVSNLVVQLHPVKARAPGLDLTSWPYVGKTGLRLMI